MTHDKYYISVCLLEPNILKYAVICDNKCFIYLFVICKRKY